MIKQKQLEDFCTALLRGVGVPPEVAAGVAAVLVDTTLEGVDTHGVSRLPIYLSRVENGRINACPRLGVERTGPSTARVDGDNGLGQWVAMQAMATAISLAGEAGVGCVTVSHSNHFGASAYYCKMASEKNMIGMAFTNTPAGIPPWGGKSAYFGTNPVAFSFPYRGFPVTVDMSTSVVARGNIIEAAKQGKSIPEGWAIDADGAPTTDAKRALAGAVLPMAGPKGYALALAVEVLAGVLSGAAVGKHVGWIYDDSLEPVDIGHCFLAIDVARFMPVETFANRMAAMVDEIKATPRAIGEAILIPGERRKNVAAKRASEGVPLSRQLTEELNQFAARLGLEPLPVN